MRWRMILAMGIGVVLCLAATIVWAAAEPSPEGKAPAPTRITTVQAIVLGFIQGLTEYLPVSSTGHLILANHAMGLTPSLDPAHPFMSGFTKNEGVDAFDVVLHLGTFLAVLGLYYRRIGQMVRGLLGRDPAGLRLLGALGIAFLPAAVIGYKFKGRIEDELYNPIAVAAALAVGGVLMIVIEHYFWRRRRDVRRTTEVTDVRLWQALAIGLAQCLALWPGTSRSMITILAGLVLGLDMLAAAEFSFLLALPTLLAATFYTGYKNWNELVMHVGPAAMIVGTVVTLVVAVLAIKGLVKWLTRHGLMPFGIYRLALAAAVLAYFVLA